MQTPQKWADLEACTYLVLVVPVGSDVTYAFIRHFPCRQNKKNQHEPDRIITCSNISVPVFYLGPKSART